jgi:hypothetical protein
LQFFSKKEESWIRGCPKQGSVFSKLGRVCREKQVDDDVWMIGGGFDYFDVV